jgi:uncharacterized protein YbaR (Trm112 family)
MSKEEATDRLPPQVLDDWFLDLLECPGCEYHLPLNLNAESDCLICACGRFGFPVREGIPILLVEEATVLNATADPSAVPKGEAS